MREVFKYARNALPGEQLPDGRVIKSIQVVIQLEDHPWYSVPADDVLLVSTSHPIGNFADTMNHLRHAEDSARSIAPIPGSDASEALLRLRRLEELIERASADKSNI